MQEGIAAARRVHEHEPAGDRPDEVGPLLRAQVRADEVELRVLVAGRRAVADEQHDQHIVSRQAPAQVAERALHVLARRRWPRPAPPSRRGRRCDRAGSRSARASAVTNAVRHWSYCSAYGAPAGRAGHDERVLVGRRAVAGSGEHDNAHMHECTHAQRHAASMSCVHSGIRDVRAFVAPRTLARPSAFLPSCRSTLTEPPPPAQHPFSAQQDDDERERPGLVPEIAALGRRVGRHGRLQPRRDAARPRRRARSGRPSCAGHAPQERLVQPRIGELAVRSADVEPAIGRAERRRAPPRLGVDLEEPRLLDADGRGVAARRRRRGARRAAARRRRAR